MLQKIQLALSVGLAVTTCLLHVPDEAFSQDPYYKGKTLTIIQSRRPGGTGDMRVRAMVPLLKKHIPGNPNIVMRYMPGAGGAKASNHLYRAARPNGLTIANTSVGMTVQGVVGAPGVRYDLKKFIFLGSPYSTNFSLFVTMKKTGFDSLKKLRAHEGIRIGGQSVGFITYIEGRVFAYFLDLKDPVFVTGYGGSEMDLALQRGEIDGRSNVGETVLRRHPRWIERNLIDLHAALESPKGFRFKHPAFASVPALETFVRNEKERDVLNLVRSFRYAGTPWVAPPGVPKERAEILQNAMRKTLKDPEFFKRYEKLTGAVPTPLLPEEQTKAIRGFPRDPEVISVIKKLAGPGALPPR